MHVKDTPLDERRDYDRVKNTLLRKRDIEVSRRFKFRLFGIQVVTVVCAVMMNLWYAENLRTRLFSEGLAAFEVRNVMQDFVTQNAIMSTLVVLGLIFGVRLLVNLVVMTIVYLTYKEEE